MLDSTPIHRPAAKQDTIQAAIRSRIIAGDFSPGTRLPKRTELEKEFGVSRVTIQRVFDQLMADGFIYANGRGGTYVVDRPPHLCRYALVFANSPAQWNRFMQALHHEAQSLSQAGSREVVTYVDVDARRVGSRAHAQLRVDAGAEALAGMILTSAPGDFGDPDFMRDRAVPRVAISFGLPLPDLPLIHPDMRSFVDEALDFFAARGRRRVAVITVPGFDNHYLQAGLAARGMATAPYLLQGVSHHTPEWARNCAHLLLNDGQRERPDGLLITDDNLVEHAMAGVVTAGARVGDGLDVVGHCNFPWPTPSVLPIRRLGFDAGEVLRTCLDAIDRRRRGERVEPMTRIAARFEDQAPG
jgi:DNA-binding LacI/PurR family transcriptional regulator